MEPSNAIKGVTSQRSVDSAFSRPVAPNTWMANGKFTIAKCQSVFRHRLERKDCARGRGSYLQARLHDNREIRLLGQGGRSWLSSSEVWNHIEAGNPATTDLGPASHLRTAKIASPQVGAGHSVSLNPLVCAWLDNIRILVAGSEMRFADYTVLGESAKEPEASKNIRPSSRSDVNSRSVQATGIAPRLDRRHVEPVDLTTFYKTISAQGKLAMKQKSEQGESMHQAPLGYRNVHVRGRTVLEPDPNTYPLVEDARRLRQQGCTIRTICQVMAERGLRSTRGKVIGHSSMRLGTESNMILS